jgi:hypothetical protein
MPVFFASLSAMHYLSNGRRGSSRCKSINETVGAVMMRRRYQRLHHGQHNLPHHNHASAAELGGCFRNSSYQRGVKTRHIQSPVQSLLVHGERTYENSMVAIVGRFRFGSRCIFYIFNYSLSKAGSVDVITYWPVSIFVWPTALRATPSKISWTIVDM